MTLDDLRMAWEHACFAAQLAEMWLAGEDGQAVVREHGYVGGYTVHDAEALASKERAAWSSYVAALSANMYAH